MSGPACASMLPALLVCTLCALSLLAGASRAGTTAEPRLALALVGGVEEPGLLLAQRAVEREWGLSEDSVYTTVDVPGWRSEGTALALSAVLPGAGQAYAGSSRAWWFAIAEVMGWTARWIFLERGHDFKHDASVYAGPPADSTSRWSFERWEQTSGGDAAWLRALYVNDPEAFYDRIGGDAAYLSGWSDDPATTRGQFSALREDGETRLGYAKMVESGLWANHLVSAFDALRAARLHDLRLGGDMKLRLGGGWSHGGPELSAAVRRSF